MKVGIWKPNMKVGKDLYNCKVEEKYDSKYPAINDERLWMSLDH